MAQDLTDTELALYLGIGGSLLLILNCVAIFYLSIMIKRYRKISRKIGVDDSETMTGEPEISKSSRLENTYTTSAESERF